VKIAGDPEIKQAGGNAAAASSASRRCKATMMAAAYRCATALHVDAKSSAPRPQESSETLRNGRGAAFDPRQGESTGTRSARRSQRRGGPDRAEHPVLNATVQA